ncbi:hypothetical protein [Rubinisphaera sp.]|uniref:hypothetical protein n=1 Tax=Rubinisphaera sp. TaxID=2024857 RepID=UPI0025D03121|nr:hypothetical protein [Rubinisphaera sp.]|tara:strand:+ start:6026 stop:6265 length:240 start_codon:yes stop_codon:yes gene_type:complete
MKECLAGLPENADDPMGLYRIGVRAMPQPSQCPQAYTSDLNPSISIKLETTFLEQVASACRFGWGDEIEKDAVLVRGIL